MLQLKAATCLWRRRTCLLKHIAHPTFLALLKPMCSNLFLLEMLHQLVRLDQKLAGTLTETLLFSSF